MGCVSLDLIDRAHDKQNLNAEQICKQIKVSSSRKIHTQPLEGKRQENRVKLQYHQLCKNDQIQKTILRDKQQILKKYEIKPIPLKTLTINSYQYDTLLSHNPDVTQNLGLPNTNNSRTTAIL